MTIIKARKLLLHPPIEHDDEHDEVLPEVAGAVRRLAVFSLISEVFALTSAVFAFISVLVVLAIKNYLK